MKTLKGLDQPVLNLDGSTAVEPRDGKAEPVPVLIRSLIANAVARGQSADPVGAMKIALDIHTAKAELKLENADFDIVKASVIADQGLTNLGKAAALSVLDDSGAES